MLNKILLFIVIIITIVPDFIVAEEKLSLSLGQCISIAQQNSPAAKIALQRYKAIEWDHRAFRAGLFPQISMDMIAPQFNRSINPIVLDDGTTRFLTQKQAFSSLNLSVLQEVPWTGGRFLISSGVQRLDLFTEADNSFIWQSTPLVLQFQQPIFQFNALKWESKLSGLRYKAAQSALNEDLEGIAAEAAGNYFDFYIAKINLQIAQTNYTVNDTVFKISTGRYNVGKIAENDLLQSELKLMEAKTQVSRSTLDLKKAEENLRIHLDLYDDVKLETEVPQKIISFEIDPDFAVTQAKKNRSDPFNFKYRKMQAERDLNRAEANSGINGSFTASYGYNQTADEFSKLYENPLDQQFFNISFQVPLFRWGKGHAQIEAEMARLVAEKNATAVAKKEFYKSVYFQAVELSQLQDQAVLAAKSDLIAERRFEVAKNRYLIGKIDITNMFIAQNEKDMAKRSNIATQKQYWIAYYRLRQLTLYDFENGNKLYSRR